MTIEDVVTALISEYPFNNELWILAEVIILMHGINIVAYNLVCYNMS